MVFSAGERGSPTYWRHSNVVTNLETSFTTRTQRDEDDADCLVDCSVDFMFNEYYYKGDAVKKL